MFDAVRVSRTRAGFSWLKDSRQSVLGVCLSVWQSIPDAILLQFSFASTAHQMAINSAV
jgi:hypothetical protein